MPFTKLEMQDELLAFLAGFGRQIAQLYGTEERTWMSDEAIRASAVWSAVSDMYDYGVAGIPTPDLNPGAKLDGLHANVDRFLHSLDTMAMKIYLHDAIDASPPQLAIRTAKTATARLVLDGGERGTDYATDEHGLGNGNWGYLTLSEVALLANMDERSVRNAANPKLPDPLKTTPVGKRSLVALEEARRWLQYRKGFVQTMPNEVAPAPRVPEFDIILGSTFQPILKEIQRESVRTGVPESIIFERKLRVVIEKFAKEGGLK